MILKDVWKDKVNNKDIILAEDINNIAKAVIENERNKVDKVDGKGLSTEDFTTVDKEKLENTVGEKSEGENSAIFGSSTNELKELELPDKIYYKPIAEEYYDIKVTGEPVFTTQAGQDVSNMGSWACVVKYDTLYIGELYAVAENKIYKVKLQCDSVFIEVEAPTDVTYYHRADIPVPDGTEIKFYETEPTKQYKFENLTFTTDKTDTLLKRLYTYTDLWGNKCYTVYKDYTPDIANGSTAIAEDENAPYELTEDKTLANSQPTIYKYDSEGMLKGLRYEALFNQGVYFAVADGENTFSSGEDNVASGDDVFSVGYRNIVLADGSTALGRMLLVRGVGANGFGLGGKATGRYAMVLNEKGEAIGYATLVFGDHCGAYDYYGVAGGFKSKNYAKMTFLYGNECIADKEVRNSFGGGDKIHIYKGFDNFIWGKELEGAGNYNGIVGAFNNIIGHNNLVGGNTNYVGSSDNMVGGTKNTIKNYPDKAQNGRAIISGANNTLEAGWGVALLGYHLHNIVGNNVLMTGEHNTNSGLYSVNCGNYNNSNGSYNVMLGMYLSALKGYNVMLGRHLESEGSHCTLIGEFLKATGYFKTIIGKYNAPSNNPFVVAYGSDDANRKNIFEVTEGGKAISKETETEAVILKAPNGNKFILTVNNNGELVTKGA